ncbi:hypothetical protein C8J56DRAFT_774009, partial [Mycena floridula]
SSIEIASRAADNFVRLYYAAYDADTRLADLPAFYRPSSSLTWNGKPFEGTEGLSQLVTKMPPTKHEVQSFDCHPIPGTTPPSLLIQVSGSVTHGRGPASNPPSAPNKTVDGHPRVFSQTFMLQPDPTAPTKNAGELPKYFIGADAMRFVG